MWFDGIRQPNTMYVASVSRGKDSTAMLRAIQLMGWPLDAIASVDIWFDENTPAELPPMVAFKDEWDSKCIEWFGVPVTRLCARKKETGETLTYMDVFYRPSRAKKALGGGWEQRVPDNQNELVQFRPQARCLGFPTRWSPWCQENKMYHLQSKASLSSAGAGVKTASRRTASAEFSEARPDKAQKINIIHYIGIAADEPLRIARHMPKKDKVLPLVQIGWDEALCGLEAQYMDMLSPTYTTSMRDGCWFCHNQGIAQLRILRKNYPDLWEKLLRLDNDSPVTFHADGHTVHDFDRRFAAEDEGLIRPDEKFRWADLDQPQLRWF